MIPPPPKGKPVALYDTECFPNFWLLKFRVRNGPVFSFSLRAGETFSPEQCAKIRYLFEIYLTISFNGNYYDVPMITAALCGFNTEQLKWVSDRLILYGIKPWDLGLPIEWKPLDHIDVMEVLPGAGSQKQYAGRVHSKTMRDLPFEVNRKLTTEEIFVVDSYCENDLQVLSDIYDALEPQRVMREHLSERYGMDLRSKSDAQLAEAVIKRRCEEALGYRIGKPEIDWNLKFRYTPPSWMSFQDPGLQRLFEGVKSCIFSINEAGRVGLPPQLEGLEIPLGKSLYKFGIGGLHSKDKRAVYLADADWCIRDNDVASYYPNLILMSGKFPPALGPVFLEVLRLMKDERLTAKNLEKSLKERGDTSSYQFQIAHVENEGGKVMINGTFGKTGSPFSILFAPEMLIQTTITGQLALLMVIEWHEMQGIEVVSANTDGFVIRCRRDQVPVSQSIIEYWQKQTGLEMESTEYSALYSRDVNNYYGVLAPKYAKKEEGGVKRKGEYARSGLIEKKNPDVEICSDAVAEFLARGVPIMYSLAACRDIRKFVTVRAVAGGAIKLWGVGPRAKLVRDMVSTLIEKGWTKHGHKWSRGEITTDATTAYKACFDRQRPEYLGKVIRWYYGTDSPGTIIYNDSGNTVGLSYGAQPCMTLPDEFPRDIDYNWYAENCETMLEDVGFYDVHCRRCKCKTKDGICQNYGCESA